MKSARLPVSEICSVVSGNMALPSSIFILHLYCPNMNGPGNTSTSDGFSENCRFQKVVDLIV